MVFNIVCHECEHSLYEGNEMIHLFRLRRKINNRCPSCGRKLSIHPLRIKVQNMELDKIWFIEKL